MFRKVLSEKDVHTPTETPATIGYNSVKAVKAAGHDYVLAEVADGVPILSKEQLLDVPNEK